MPALASETFCADPWSASSSRSKRLPGPVERADESVARPEVDALEVGFGIGGDLPHLGDERDALRRRASRRVDDGPGGGDLLDGDVAHVGRRAGELVDGSDLPPDEGQHPHRHQCGIGGVAVRGVELGARGFELVEIVTFEDRVGRHRRPQPLQPIDAGLRVAARLQELDPGVGDPDAQPDEDERDPERGTRSQSSLAVRARRSGSAHCLHQG